MLAVIDVIEQVMSNAAIEKIDPLNRKCNSNNSLSIMVTINIWCCYIKNIINWNFFCSINWNTITNKLNGNKYNIWNI